MLSREDADLLTARETQMNINARTERITTRITDWDQYRSLDAGHLRLFVNFHSLSAAVRKEVFRRIPFREANFAEDLIWGKEVLEAGYRIQYEPSAVAYHSHNYSFLDTFRRNFDDGIACAKIIGMESADADVAPSIAHLVREDWRYLETDCQLSPGELESWRLNAAMRRAAQITGHWLGVNFERSGGRLLPLLSITEQIKAGAKTESSEGWRACHAAAIG
jgi:rhamnosyltransferase